MATSTSSHSPVKTESTLPPASTRSAGSSPRATAIQCASMRVKDKALVPERISTPTDDPRLARRDPASMKRTTLALALLTLLASACGAAPAVASHSPSTSATAPDPAAAGPLNCRLPVAGFVISAPKGMPDKNIGADGQANKKGTGGYLDLPSRKFTPAPERDRAYPVDTHAWLPV